MLVSPSPASCFARACGGQIDHREIHGAAGGAKRIVVARPEQSEEVPLGGVSTTFAVTSVAVRSRSRGRPGPRPPGSSRGGVQVVPARWRFARRELAPRRPRARAARVSTPHVTPHVIPVAEGRRSHFAKRVDEPSLARRI